jgi:hypothetical protein
MSMTLPGTRCATLFETLMVAALGLTMSACVIHVESDDYKAREEKRFAVTGTPDVSLVTFDGPIEVRSWDRPEVMVTVEKSGAVKELVDAITVRAEQNGNRIHVEARRPDSSDWTLRAIINTSRKARILAAVPRGCHLLARSGDGGIQAERITGRIELHTGDGAVQGIDLEGDIRAETGDGAVKLEAIDGTLDIKTADGSIAASGRLRSVRALTGDGSIVLTAEKGSTMGDTWEVSTGDGGIVVYVPDQFDANLDASTDDGVVRADASLGLKVLEDRNHRQLRATLGSGGPVLRIRTADGSINLRKQ